MANTATSLRAIEQKTIGLASSFEIALISARTRSTGKNETGMPQCMHAPWSRHSEHGHSTDFELAYRLLKISAVTRTHPAAPAGSKTSSAWRKSLVFNGK